MKRPLEQDYTSLVAYTRALEEYCDGLAQRTWVGLTDQEIWTLLQFRGYNPDTVEIAKAIEAKLKELNHD